MLVLRFTLWLLDFVSGILAIYPELLCHLPFISFYAKTKGALEKIKKTLDSNDIVKSIAIDAETTEHFKYLIILLERLYGKQTKTITEIRFDILPFNDDDPFLERIAANSHYYLSVISNNNIIYKKTVDNKLSEWNQTLDWMIRKRLAIAFAIFAFGTLVLLVLEIGVIK